MTGARRGDGRARRRWLIGLVGVIGVGVALVGVSTQATRFGGASAPVVSASGGSGPTGTGHVVAQLAGLPTRMAYDEARHRLWFVLAGAGTLYEVAADTETVLRHPLPDSRFGGFGVQVALTPSGAVWIATPYALLHYDATSGVRRAATLERDRSGHRGALGEPSAVQDWVTSLATRGEDAVFTRGGQASLFTLTAAGGEPAQLAELTAAEAGALLATDVTGTVWGLAQGDVTAPRHAFRIDAAGHRVEVVGAELAAMGEMDGRIRLPRPDLAGAASPGGYRPGAFELRADALVRLRGGTVTASLPRRALPGAMPGLGAGEAAAHGASSGVAAAPPGETFFDVLVVSDTDVWVTRGKGDLYHWTPPA